MAKHIMETLLISSHTHTNTNNNNVKIVRQATFEMVLTGYFSFSSSHIKIAFATHTDIERLTHTKNA